MDLAFESTYLDGGNRVGAHVTEWPINGSITQVFGQLSVTGSRHGGMDIAPDSYRPIIYAPAPGRVVLLKEASEGYDFGNWITLDHAGTPWFTAYGHMSEFLAEAGQLLREGDPIGRVGNTGKSFGDHLHWALGTNPNFALDFSQLADPAHYASQEDDALDPQDRAALDLVRNVLYRWGVYGYCRPSTADLFPPGTPQIHEDADDGPVYILTGDQAEEYVSRRGFAFGLSLLGHLIHHPSSNIVNGSLAEMADAMGPLALPEGARRLGVGSVEMGSGSGAEGAVEG